MPRNGTNAVADITAEERYYSRSLKIRLAVAECMAILADQEQSGAGRMVWNSLDELSGYCGNYILDARWDKKPASSVTCGRWIKQFLLPNGMFTLSGADAGGFSVVFRSGKSRLLVHKILAEYKVTRKRRRKA